MNTRNVLCCEKKASQAWQNHKQECSLVCGFVATGSSLVLIFAVISRNTISIPESVHVFASLTVIILIFWWLYSLVIAVVVFQGSMIALGDFSAYNNTQVNQKHLIKCTFVAKCNRLYDMATVVCMLVLQAAKRTLLTYNDVAFQATCRCPWHIQYYFVWSMLWSNWQLSKRVSTDHCHMTVSWAQVYNSIAWSMHQGLSLRFPCDDLTLT